jgi:hypothetical protein
MSPSDEQVARLEREIERRMLERMAAIRDEFDRLRAEQESRWKSFLLQFEQDLHGVVPRELLEEGAPAAEPPSPPAFAEVRAVAVDLESALNQVEILNRFLSHCAERASRVLLLINRGETLVGWKAVGFAARGRSDEEVRSINLRVVNYGVLQKALDGRPIRLASDSSLAATLTGGRVARALLVPMTVKEKISALLYADAAAGEEDRYDEDALVLWTFLAGSAVDRLVTRKLVPPPALVPPEQIGEDSLPAPASTVAIPISPDVIASARAAAAPAPEPEPSLEIVEEFEAPRPSAAAAAAPQPAPARAAPPPPPPAAPPRPDLEEPGGVAPVRPPSDLGGGEGARALRGPLAPPAGDSRHEEARRLARLLVSEIKLYNEGAVEEGRKRHDIYSRLKDDIDRSRQMYEERTPSDVRAASDYFRDELVRLLADGDSGALGS